VGFVAGGVKGASGDGELDAVDDLWIDARGVDDPEPHAPTLSASAANGRARNAARAGTAMV
jgi:hypothetical protein